MACPICSRMCRQKAEFRVCLARIAVDHAHEQLIRWKEHQKEAVETIDNPPREGGYIVWYPLSYYKSCVDDASRSLNCCKVELSKAESDLRESSSLPKCRCAYVE